jgi:hypothetical protein
VYRVYRILVFSFILVIISAATACAISFTDADEDGICEPGEEITFEGDPHFDYYDWDFDGDGLPDDNGAVVTYIFEEEGVYIVTLVETNGHTEQHSMIIIVQSDDNNDPDPDEKKGEKLEKKIEKILGRQYRNNVKYDIMIKLLTKEFNKMKRKGQNNIDFDEVLEQVE